MREAGLRTRIMRLRAELVGLESGALPFVAQKRRVTARDLAREFRVSEQVANNRLAALRAAGLVGRSKQILPHGGRRWLYHAIDNPSPTESVLERIRPTARACGYAVAVHGSQLHDLDLIAVPWTAHAVYADALVDCICGNGQFALIDRVVRPHGRIGYALAGASGFTYIDLSVIMPRMDDP